MPRNFKEGLKRAAAKTRAFLISSIRRVTRSIGVDVVKFKPQKDSSLFAFDLLLQFREALGKVNNSDDLDFLLDCAANLKDSKSQILQDLLVVHQLRGKRGGYFVEFGSTNGINLSNTYVLEKQFGWSGILAEPARCWADALRSNRQCAIELRCVWSRTGETLRFLEVSDAELSTVVPFAERDEHSGSRTEHREYSVETISLMDLLKLHNAPRAIDYLSIDTEGSEYEILSTFDFDAYDIKIITVEHNYIENDRNRLFELLSSKGYTRTLQKFSLWDDWYVRSVPATAGEMVGCEPVEA